MGTARCGDLKEPPTGSQGLCGQTAWGRHPAMGLGDPAAGAGTRPAQAGGATPCALGFRRDSQRKATLSHNNEED